MKTLEQKIIELREKLNFGVKISRVLLGLVIVSLIVNVALGSQLYNLKFKQTEDIPTIMSTGTMEQIEDNVFTIIPDDTLNSLDLPPIPEHLKQ